jgi:UDP-glucose 4-epimerase
MTIREGFAGKGVLVTGGAGFIGSHLVDRLLAEGAAHVVVIDNLFVGSEDNLVEALASGKATFYRDDAELSTSLEYIFANQEQKHKKNISFQNALQNPRQNS